MQARHLPYTVIITFTMPDGTTFYRVRRIKCTLSAELRRIYAFGEKRLGARPKAAQIDVCGWWLMHEAPDTFKPAAKWDASVQKV